MKYYVDVEDCIGCGLCADLCPDVFRMNDDGVAEAFADGDGEEAKDACPTGAIKEE